MLDTTINGSFGARYFVGNDAIVFDGTTITGKAVFDLNGGSDTVRMKRTTIGGDLLLGDKPISDPGVTTNVELFDVNVRGRVDMRFVDVNAKISIDGGTTADQRSSIAGLVVVGGGKDTVTIQHADIGTASLDLGADTDTVKFVDAVFEQLAVYLGDGSDVLNISNTRVTKRTTFNGGAGRDQFVNGGGNSLAGATIINFEA